MYESGFSEEPIKVYLRRNMDPFLASIDLVEKFSVSKDTY